GYIGIMLAWLVGRLKRGRLSQYANLAFLMMTAFGLAFSIYLTFLEPFVIGATCAWCLTSAVLMTALFWLAQQPGKRAGKILFSKQSSTANV
ncbi:MAG: vitamin K epoxide reductase family protein, partial [Chloroflexota bacterium]